MATVAGTAWQRNYVTASQSENLSRREVLYWASWKQSRETARRNSQSNV